MDRGYVKLWRKSIDSRVWASNELWKLWTWCLIKASYRKRFVPITIGKGVSSVEIMPGQFVWGRLSCAKEFGWNPSTTLKRMKKLESLGCLSLKSDTHYSVVSICNWASYQSEEDAEVTTRCQPSDNQVTTKGQPSDNQVTQTRRVKKLKKLKKEKANPTLSEVKTYFSENGYSETAGENAWHYYKENDWEDSNGKPVLNWKSKMRAVWFKDDNKKTGTYSNFNDDGSSRQVAF